MQTPRNLYSLLDVNIRRLDQLNELVQILKKSGASKTTVRYWEDEVGRLKQGLINIATGIAEKIDIPGTYDSNG